MRKLLLIAMALIATAAVSRAMPSYTFTRFQEKNGMPTTTIEKIIQDRNGFLWLASWSGLYRFNGTDFTRYETSPAAELSGNSYQNRLMDLHSDGFGHIWVLSSNNTLYRLDPHSRRSEKETPLQVTSIFKLSGTDFRFPTARGTILKCEYSGDGKKCTLTRFFSIPRDENVNLICTDSSGNVWTLTSRAIYRNTEKFTDMPGLCFLDNGGTIYFGSTGGQLIKVQGESATVLQSKTHHPVELLVKTGDGKEFPGGSSRGGLFCWDPATDEAVRIKGCTDTGRPLKYQKDSRGNIWIYTKRGSLCWYDPDKKELVPFYNPEFQHGWNSETFLNTMYVDSQDNLWISGSWGGLEHARYNPGEFKLKRIDDDPEASGDANNVRAVLQGSSGMIYAATRDNRIHLLDDRLEEVAVWPTDGPVYTMAETADGTVWLGSKGAGITENLALPHGSIYYAPRVWRKNEEDFYGSDCDLVYDLNTADSNRLWISSFDSSLSYLDLGGKRQFISRKNRISFPTQQLNRMRYSCFGPDGKLYAGGSLGVFVCDNPGGEPEEMTFERFMSVADFDVQHLLFSEDGRLWASSSGNGFISFDSTEPDSGVKLYTTEDGLMSNFVLSAVEDRSGNIWIASNGGLNKFNPQTSSIIGYPYSRMGLDIQFNEGRPLLADDGEIFFNTTGGLLHFNPDEISNSSYVPRILINFIIINGRRRDPDDFGRARMKRNSTLDLHFQAIDLAAPDRVIYYYKLDGRDESWNSLGHDPFLHISGLKPGRYVLRLRSTNADGVAVDNERSMHVIVSPGLLLFYILLPLVLLGAGVAGILVLRTKKTPPEEPAAEDSDAARFRGELTAFLKEHIDDGELNIASIASAMNMSRSALFQKCRESLQMTPLEYLKELRFAKAAEMLGAGKHSIAQTAWATGFNDAHYFSKAFKQKFGMTPSEYRKSRSDKDIRQK